MRVLSPTCVRIGVSGVRWSGGSSAVVSTAGSRPESEACLDAAEGCAGHDRKVPSGGGAGCKGGQLHEWRYSRRGAPSPDCERPSLLVCVRCGEQRSSRCGGTKSSRCEPCGGRHRRRVGRLVLSGTDHPSGLFFVTLTAPGVDVLPWDRCKCNHGPEVECSGRIGCVVDAVPAADWNAQGPRAWSWFVTYLRRSVGVEVEYCGVWEVQRRGVLHRHAVFRCVGVTQRRFRAAVRLSAMRWGFGRQIDVQAFAPGHAWYLAKYASKSADEMGDCSWLDRATGELVEAHYRPWSASRGWGSSMALIREAQRRWAVAARSPKDEGTGGAAGGGALDPSQESSTVSVREDPSVMPAERVSGAV